MNIFSSVSYIKIRIEFEMQESVFDDSIWKLYV